MKIKRIFEGLLLFSMLIALVGCGDKYSETDAVAEQTWKKMTIKERNFYQKVEKIWYEAPLMYVREAVRKREVAPEEYSVPFIDIADLIVTTNDMNLIIPSNLNTDQKRDRALGKWDAIDPDWYRIILQAAGKTGSNKPYRENGRVVNESTKSHGDSSVEVRKKPLDLSQKIIEKTSMDSFNDVISSDQLGKMSYEISHCEQATDYISSVMREKRPFSYADKEEIGLRILFCNTVMMQKYIKY